MAKGESNILYNSVISIANDYLGPASQRFMDRQIISHLDKQPDQLKTDDLAKLIEWTQASMSLLTNDRSIVDEFSARMLLLSNNSQKKLS